MAQPQNHPLRPLNVQEERELHRIVKASSERIDVARRARALLAVAAKQSFPQAARVAGFKEARSVSELVEGASQPTRASSRRVSSQKCSGSPIEKSIRRRPGR